MLSSSMRIAAILFIHLLVSIAKLLGPGGAKGLLAETLLEKHQLIVLNRPHKRAPNLTVWDRLVFGLCCFFIAPGRVAKNAVSISTASLFKFHDALKKRKYSRLFSSARSKRKPGPKGPSQDLIDAIVAMKTLNPRYGCPSWVLLVMDQHTRSLIGFGVQIGAVDSVALCHMFAQATSGMGVPKRLSSDNAPLFLFHQWNANLRVLEIEEVKSVPYVPMSHPFVERLIGTIRREYLDQVFFWNAVELERKLGEFKSYYNDQRTYTSLDGTTPAEKAGGKSSKLAKLDDFRWQRHCGGLFVLPMAA